MAESRVNDEIHPSRRVEIHTADGVLRGHIDPDSVEVHADGSVSLTCKAGPVVDALVAGLGPPSWPFTTVTLTHTFPGLYVSDCGHLLRRDSLCSHRRCSMLSKEWQRWVADYARGDTPVTARGWYHREAAEPWPETVVTLAKEHTCDPFAAPVVGFRCPGCEAAWGETWRGPVAPPGSIAAEYSDLRRRLWLVVAAFFAAARMPKTAEAARAAAGGTQNG